MKTNITDCYNLLEVSTDGAETWRPILPSNGQMWNRQKHRKIGRSCI